jgi:hypothetical protein
MSHIPQTLPRWVWFFIGLFWRPLCLTILLSGVRLSPLGTAATTGLFYQTQMIDNSDCGAISGMKIGRGNRSTRRNPAPVPFCPQQIPHDLTRPQTRAAAAGSQRLTAWDMERPQVTMLSIVE